MAHQVPWNKVIVEEFVSQAMLTKDEEFVLRTRVAGWSRIKQSMELGLSVASVDKIIARLKKKYDKIAKFNPILPPRRNSAEETWMDNN